MASPATRAAAALALLSALAGTAGAEVLYRQDFQNSSYNREWSRQVFDEGAAFSRFLGRFGNDSATLTLPERSGGLPEGYTYLLRFDFYCIDSWDGDDPLHGPDRFAVSVNDTSILDETFANQHEYQSYRRPDVGPIPLGFDGRWNDSIYRIDLPFAFTGPTMNIRFGARGLQSLNDESWGIDNVRVEVVPIPAPGAALPVLGALAVSGRRRRS